MPIERGKSRYHRRLARLVSNPSDASRLDVRLEDLKWERVTMVDLTYTVKERIVGMLNERPLRDELKVTAILPRVRDFDPAVPECPHAAE